MNSPSQKFSAAFNTQESARAHIDAIISEIAEGNTEAGLKMTKPFSILSDAEIDAMIQLTTSQLPAISKNFGESIGYELIDTRTIGTSLLRLVYLQKLEIHGLRWTFVLYHGAEGWTINTFYFDDKIEELFK